MLSTETRVNTVIGTGHFFSHFYILALPPLFIAWRDEFDVSFTALGLSVALMSGMTALLQTPAGFLVDRYGAKTFLILGTLLMSLTVAAMAFATSYWQIVVLAALSGVGNAIFHPADYSILSGSIAPERLGRAFGYHLFGGHLGFALAPPVVAVLAVTLGWQLAILLVGLAGIPVAAAIAWQSSVLKDQSRKPKTRGVAPSPHGTVIFSRAMLLFFAFFMFGSMAQAGIQAWLITVLQTVNGISFEAASTALTGFVSGTVVGILIGGWLSDKANNRHLFLATVLVFISAVTIFAVGVFPLPSAVIFVLVTISGTAFGTSRVSRDMIVKNATPPGEIGKVFGFVSTGLPLGQALTPVPFGFLIDTGHADYVLVAAAAILLLSIVCGGTAGAREQSRAVATGNA